MGVPNAGDQIAFGDSLPKGHGKVDKPVVVSEMKAAVVVLGQYARWCNDQIALENARVNK